MTREEVTLVLRMFEANWTTFRASDETARLWEMSTQMVSGQTGVTAAKRIVAVEARQPAIADFLAECRNIERARGTLPSPADLRPACDCDHGFRAGRPVEQVYPGRKGSPPCTAVVDTVYPCQKCNPVAHTDWLNRAAEGRARRARVVPVAERTYEANPQAGLTQARDALAEAVERMKGNVSQDDAWAAETEAVLARARTLVDDDDPGF